MVGENANTVASDQKKRTSKALEERFAREEAQALQQQQPKTRKLTHVEEGEGLKNMNSSSKTSQGRESDKLDIPSSSSTPFSNKGHFGISGHTPSRGAPKMSDAEANCPAYSQICQPVHENLLSTHVEPTGGRGSAADNIFRKLLQHGDSAQKYNQGSRRMKLDNSLLLDSLVQGRDASLGTRIKASQSHSKRSRKHMSMKQHKNCGSFDLPQEFHKFDYFKPMHDMWKDYITETLKNVRENLAQYLLKADLHGAILIVADCKVTSFTGVSGIMVRETAETFGIITQDNKFRVVPKKASVFVFQTDCWKITLHGDKLTSRNFVM